MVVIPSVSRTAGTWEREAHRVAVLSADLGTPLDAEQLALSDVRDLVALRLRLQASRRRTHGRHSRRWTWPL